MTVRRVAHRSLQADSSATGWSARAKALRSSAVRPAASFISTDSVGEGPLESAPESAPPGAPDSWFCSVSSTISLAGSSPTRPCVVLGSYRESTHVKLSIYRISSHFFAVVRMTLHQGLRMRKLNAAIQLCRLRQVVPDKLGCKRSWVQIPPARLSQTASAEALFAYLPAVGSAAGTS
jgi:hypothetical protein